jgi:anti-sigma factor RsiW
VAGRDADAAIPGLRAHLEGCPACREEHESLYALVSGKRALYSALGLAALHVGFPAAVSGV